MIIKNLKSLLHRYPVAVLLNFTGLVGAFVAFALIILQAQYELSFDKCHPAAERIFRIDKADDQTLFRNVLPRGFVDDVIGSSAHIQAGTALLPFYGSMYFTVTGEQTGYKRDVVFASAAFIDTFGIPMVEGDNTALAQGGHAIIPRSLASVLFPDGPALGKTLKTDVTGILKDGIATIGGVYEDFPSNTQLNNVIYLALDDILEGNYESANFVGYVKLDDTANAQAVADEFNAHFQFDPNDDWLSPIKLVPFTSIYFLHEGGIYKSGSLGQLILLIGIAILILGIGLINFTNFYVALTPLRIHSINLQKILGSSTSHLRHLVVAESLIWCLCAFAVAALLLGPVSDALFTSGVLMQPFALSRHGALLATVGAVAVATGILAGIWPGIYSTSGQPALILRGNFGLSASGKTLRAILVGVQLVISTALLVFVLYVQHQSTFMQEYPCGFDKTNVAVLELDQESSSSKTGWLREELRKLPEVVDVGFSGDLFGGTDVFQSGEVDFGDGNQTLINIEGCSWNLPELLGMEITEGIGFADGDHYKLLLTEDTRAHGAELKVYPTLWRDGEVKGFVKNLNLSSLRTHDTSVALVALNLDERTFLPWTYIKLTDGADPVVAVRKIRAVLKEMNPVNPYDIRFYDTIGKNLYSDEERLRLSVWIFSLLAVLLSLVGIWGQVLMDVQYKRTEIAVKRVLGASGNGILREGLWLYLKMVAVCYVVAAPLGWVISEYYLRQFVHRVGFCPDVFVLSLIVVAGLCALVVSAHYFRATRSNPSDVLKKD